MDRQRQQAIAANLRTVLAPHQWFELKALGVGSRKAVNDFFVADVGGLDYAAAKALRWEADGARSVRFSLNPLRPDIASSRRFANNDDVIGYRWLFVDCEHVVGHSDASASDAEREASWAVVGRVRGTLEAAGLSPPIVADSGNGWHLLYPIDLPNDEASKETLKELLKGLSANCSDEIARVDPGTYRAIDAAKVYGTLSRKGEPAADRPHRYSQLVEGAAHQISPGVAAPGAAEANVAAIQRLLALWHRADDVRKGPRRPAMSASQREQHRTGTYAAAALSAEMTLVASAGEGGRNEQLNRSAFALGQLVGGGGLSRHDAEAGLAQAARKAGLPEGEIVATIRSGLESGMASPRTAPEPQPSSRYNGNGNGKETNRISDVPGKEATASRPRTEFAREDVATLRDLKAAGAQIAWLCPLWLPTGVLTAIAAEPGTGKTRYCADLLRRIRYGLPWPDGSAMMLPADSRVLWVVSDNTHDELVSLAESFGILDSIYVNASKTNPYGGVILEKAEDFDELEGRIKAVKPVFVCIDTVGNATELDLYKPENAKIFYQPLQLIARRQACGLFCLTHLNSQGKVLGRRIREKVRVVVQMEAPEGMDGKRRLWVSKTNSKVPPPLGLTMGDAGNEYDDKPPEAGVSGASGAAAPASAAAVEWLREQLKLGALKLSSVLTLAKAEGVSNRSVYAAKDKLGVVEVETEGRKWWSLPPPPPGEAM